MNRNCGKYFNWVVLFLLKYVDKGCQYCIL